MDTHNIKIIYDPQLKFEKHQHQVRPAHAYVKKGDKVIFSAIDTEVEIFFPEPTKNILVDNKGKADQNGITINSDNPTETFTISNDSDPGKFPYAVYCTEGSDFAEGGSAPRMIVRK